MEKLLEISPVVDETCLFTLSSILREGELEKNCFVKICSSHLSPARFHLRSFPLPRRDVEEPSDQDSCPEQVTRGDIATRVCELRDAGDEGAQRERDVHIPGGADNKYYAFQINPDAHQPGCLDPDRSDAAQHATGVMHIPPEYMDPAVLMRKGFQPTGKINAVLKANALGDDIHITWDWRHLDHWMTTTLGDLHVLSKAITAKTRIVIFDLVRTTVDDGYNVVYEVMEMLKDRLSALASTTPRRCTSSLCTSSRSPTTSPTRPRCPPTAASSIRSPPPPTSPSISPRSPPRSPPTSPPTSPWRRTLTRPKLFKRLDAPAALYRSVVRAKPWATATTTTTTSLTRLRSSLRPPWALQPHPLLQCRLKAPSPPKPCLVMHIFTLTIYVSDLRTLRSSNQPAEAPFAPNPALRALLCACLRSPLWGSRVVHCLTIYTRPCGSVKRYFTTSKKQAPYGQFV